MRRIVALFLLFCFGGQALAQSWEKLITPGLSYRMEIRSRNGIVMHALRWSQKNPLISARSECAHLQLFSADGAAARQPISALCKETGAIAAINGDFFGTSGEPLGAMVRDGQLLSRPFPGRPSFGWGLADTGFAKLDWGASVFFESASRITLSGWNEDVALNTVGIFTPASKVAKAKTPNTVVIVKFPDATWAPTGIERGIVQDVLYNQESVPVPAGCAVIVGQGNAADLMAQVRKLEKVSVSVRTEGFDWKKIDHVVGGGPTILEKGVPKIDLQGANFPNTFSETKHPRSAVGRTSSGDLIFLVIDGRQPMSGGITLTDLAAVLQTLDCTDAINLDGGGSSELSIFGEVLNRPSDGAERPIANAILIMGPAMAPTGLTMVIKGPAQVAPQTAAEYTVVGPDGKEIPDRQILWSAMGPGGWIDQGGTLHALDSGVTHLRAFCGGQALTLEINTVPTSITPPPVNP